MFRLNRLGILLGLFLQNLGDGGGVNGWVPLGKPRGESAGRAGARTWACAAGHLLVDVRPARHRGSLLGLPVLLGIINVAREEPHGKEH